MLTLITLSFLRAMLKTHNVEGDTGCVMVTAMVCDVILAYMVITALGGFIS